MRLFNRPSDYDLFVSILAEGRTKAQVKILAFCLMPTHWHLILMPRWGEELSKFMRWVANTHVRRWHSEHRSAGGGHIYQSRYKWFPIQPDEHLLDVIAYVESNPLRAGLVSKARLWAWSSAFWRGATGAARILSPSPTPIPRDWKTRVDQPMDEETLEELRTCVWRGRPYGSAVWTADKVRELNLESSIRNPWRPKKTTPPSSLPNILTFRRPNL